MPSEKILNKKKLEVKNLANEFKETLVGVLADYSGISVSQDTSLRKSLREANVNYRVIKNNIVRRALKEANISGLDDVLTGSTVVATSKTSYSDASRILCDFAKDNDFYKIKGGFIEGEVIELSKLKALAKLPSREELISQVLRGLNSPITGLACILSGLQRSLVIALSEIAKQKS